MTDSYDEKLHELAAFTQLRGLRGVHYNWGEIIAVAQKTIAEVEEAGNEELDELRTSVAQKLLAASRSLDASCQPQSLIEATHRMLLRLEAGLAFALGGNFTASKAVLDD